MPIGIQVWQRKDGADRNELALAALQVCRVMRGYDDVSSSKLFWGGWNTIALIAEGDDTMFDFRATTPTWRWPQRVWRTLPTWCRAISWARRRQGRRATSAPDGPSGTSDIGVQTRTAGQVPPFAIRHLVLGPRGDDESRSMATGRGR